MLHVVQRHEVNCRPVLPAPLPCDPDLGTTTSVVNGGPRCRRVSGRPEDGCRVDGPHPTARACSRASERHFFKSARPTAPIFTTRAWRPLVDFWVMVPSAPTASAADICTRPVSRSTSRHRRASSSPRRAPVARARRASAWRRRCSMRSMPAADGAGGDPRVSPRLVHGLGVVAVRPAASRAGRRWRRRGGGRRRGSTGTSRRTGPPCTGRGARRR